MSTGKFSILITVLAFHASVLGIVYLSTRMDVETITPKESLAELTPKKTGKPEIVSEPKKEKYAIHTVGDNDYLGKIATKYKVTAQSIIDLNNIKNPDRIAKGSNLKIPNQ
jgi:LysM repeat protein